MTTPARFYEENGCIVDRQQQDRIVATLQTHGPEGAICVAALNAAVPDRAAFEIALELLMSRARDGQHARDDRDIGYTYIVAADAGELEAKTAALAIYDKLARDYAMWKERAVKLEPERDAIALRVTSAEAERDENYCDLLDQMDKAWGNAQEITRAEINAFLESRIIHRPTMRLRAANNVQETAWNLAADLNNDLRAEVAALTADNERLRTACMAASGEYVLMRIGTIAGLSRVVENTLHAALAPRETEGK